MTNNFAIYFSLRINYILLRPFLVKCLSRAYQRGWESAPSSPPPVAPMNAIAAATRYVCRQTTAAACAHYNSFDAQTVTLQFDVTQICATKAAANHTKTHQPLQHTYPHYSRRFSIDIHVVSRWNTETIAMQFSIHSHTYSYSAITFCFLGNCFAIFC